MTDKESNFICKLQDQQEATNKAGASPKELRQYGYDDPPINFVPDRNLYQENVEQKVVAPIYSKIVNSNENMRNNSIPRGELTQSGVGVWRTNIQNTNWQV